MSDVTLDSRAATPGALFLACQRPHPPWPEVRPARRSPAARARCSTTTHGARQPPQLRRRHLHAPRCRSCGERVGFIADRFFGAPSQAADGGRHHRHQRQDHLRVAAGAGAAALPASRGLHRHARLRRARRGDRRPQHTTSDAVTCSASSPQLRALGAECVCMEVSSHALDQDARQRRALPHRGVHQPDARPPRLPRHDGGLRGRQGAPVRLADARAPGHQRR